MGFRSPQSSLKTQVDTPSKSMRVSPGKGTQISGEFVNTLSAGVNAANKRDLDAEKKASDLNKVMAKNDFDTYRVEAEAKLADFKGTEALRNVTDIKQDYVKKLKQRLDNLPARYRDNPEFQVEAAQSAGKFDRFSIGYTSSEGRKVTDDAYKTRIANDMNDMIDNAGDVEYLATTGITKVSSSIRRDLERTYGTDYNKMLASGITVGEMINTEAEAGISEAARKSIQHQVNVGDFDKAYATFDVLKGSITPDDRDKIDGIIKAGLSKQEDNISLDLAESAFKAADGNQVLSQKIILSRSGGDGKVFSKAMSHVNTMYAVREKQKAKKNEDLFNSTYQEFTQTGAMNKEKFNAMDVETRNKLVAQLQKNGGQEAVVTDQAVFNSAMEQFDNMTYQEQLKVKVDSKYGAYVNSEDRELIKRRQALARKSIETDYASGQKWNPRVLKDTEKRFADKLGLDIKSSKMRPVKRMIYDRYTEILEQNPKITERQIEMQLTRDLDNKTQVSKELGFFSRTLNRFGADIEPEISTGVPETLSNGIPDATAAKIRAAALKGGKGDLTDAEVEAVFNSMQR